MKKFTYVIVIVSLLAPVMAIGQSVGIGSSSFAPNSGTMLAVDGGVTIGNAYRTTAAPANGMIVAGNIGIGTTNPTVNFHFYSSADASTRLQVENTGTGTGAQPSVAVVADQANFFVSAHGSG